jgi:hypothetical protein
MEGILNNMSGGLRLGGIRGLTDQVPFLKQKHKEKVNELLANCYPEFGIIMDGSPYFAEAFAMILQVVDSHTWKSFNHW